MQAHRLDDVGREVLGQPGRAEFLMHIVDAAAGGILAQLVDHVADVMEQRGQHGGGRAALGFGLGRGLQRVLQLTDRAQAIAAGGAAGIDVEKLLAQRIAHDVFLARTVCGYPGIIASA